MRIALVVAKRDRWLNTRQRPTSSKDNDLIAGRNGKRDLYRSGIVSLRDGRLCDRWRKADSGGARRGTRRGRSRHAGVRTLSRTGRDR